MVSLGRTPSCDALVLDYVPWLEHFSSLATSTRTDFLYGWKTECMVFMAHFNHQDFSAFGTICDFDVDPLCITSRVRMSFEIRRMLYKPMSVLAS